MAATAGQQQLMENYRGLMEEVKHRLDWLDAVVKGRVGLPNPAIQEFGFLQLRILCELIALGCLTAHGDLPAAKQKSILNEWNATNILKRLERLHADFYPKPVQVRDIAPGRKHLDSVTTGFLTKSELISLYGRCADLAHRGSISRLLTPVSPWPTDTTEIDGWARKIGRLLDHHHLAHFGGQSHLICMMRNPSDLYRVQVVFAEAIPDEPDLPDKEPNDTDETILPGLHPSKPWKR